MIAWFSQNQEGDLYGIYAQHFNATGQKQGVEFQVNTRTESNQYGPAVAMDRHIGDVLLDEYMLTIIDALGATVYKGIFTEKLSLDHLPKGLYQLRLENEKEAIVKQIVIQ